MKNIFSSPAQQDLQNIYQLVSTKLETITKDILYITYRVDRILKLVSSQIPTTDMIQTEQDEQDDIGDS